VLAGIAAFGVIIYAGFTMNYVNGIPLWNSALLPTLYIFWGILSGMALIMTIGLDSGAGNTLVTVNLGVLVAGMILVILYLWTATYIDLTARESVRELTRGSLSLILWLGVFIFGLLIPLVISLVSFFTGNAPALPLAILMLVCEIIGGLAFTYGVLKAGVYSPLIPGRV
jgi:formate-dependent nitrite reductase membrane component NrfD